MSIPVVSVVLTAVWCLTLVWVARIAQSRARSILVWCLIAGAAGVLGLLAGFTLAGRILDTDEPDISMLRTVGAFFTPVLAMTAPMVAAGFAVQREPIKVAATGPWKVTFMSKGPGTISVTGGKVVLDYGGARRELSPDQITRVEADGECVRLTLDAEELSAMPMGKPETPTGRRHQSLVLAKRLRIRPG